MADKGIHHIFSQYASFMCVCVFNLRSPRTRIVTVALG